MTEEELYYQRSEITDKLAYLMLYAADLPMENRRSLVEERDLLLSKIARYEEENPAASAHPRFALFKMEVAAAFEAAGGRSSDATSLFQSASERFEQTFRHPPKGPDFIAGPSGVIKL